MMSPVHIAQFRSLKVRHCDSAMLMCAYARAHCLLVFGLKKTKTFLTSRERCTMMSPVHIAQFRSLKVRHCDSAVLMCAYLCPHFLV